MQRSLRLTGAVALCAALLLSACAKKTTDQTTTTSTDTTQSGTASTAPDAGTSAAPDASASAAPDAGASPAAAAPSADTTTAATTTTTSTSNGAASGGGYIDLPVYPGATESKDQSMAMSANTGSVTIKVYASKDGAKNVADWYKAHLPAEFKGGVLTSGEKTVGTFSEEHADGDQSVVVADQDGGGTRIQLATKHGK